MTSALKLTPAEVDELERLVVSSVGLSRQDPFCALISDWRTLVAELAEANGKLSWLRTWEATEEAQDPIKANRVLLMREEIMALCDERLQERKHAARKAETRAAELEIELAALKSEREQAVEKIRAKRDHWYVYGEILAILEQHGEPPR